jgi:hypothetical protein
VPDRKKGEKRLKKAELLPVDVPEPKATKGAWKGLRVTQNPVLSGECGFESHSGIRNSSRNL